MKWLVDAQLPVRLCDVLKRLGQEPLHTTELASGNATTDETLCSIADNDGRVVVTKDRDFLDSHLVNGTPRKLLWIRTGNISNHALLRVFEQRIEELEAAFSQVDCVEVTASELILHQ